MPSGGGWWVSAQLALMGGKGEGGWCWSNPYHLPWVTRYSMPMLSPHDQGGRPWNPLLLLTGPRSCSLMPSWVPGSLASCCLFLAVVLGRCNRQGSIKKSPSEGETIIKRIFLVFFIYFYSVLKIFNQLL